MARSKTFDQRAVLEKAMAVFWQKGYEATSMQDLVAAMGINHASLYATFTDKHQLFLRAIAHYHQTVVKTVIDRLTVPDAGRNAIEVHFQTIVDQVSSDSRCHGCLMTNTIAEFGGKDEAIALLTKANLQHLEDAFFTALFRAQARAEIRPEKDIRALARYFTTDTQGLRVTSKLNPDPAALQDVVSVILAALD